MLVETLCKSESDMSYKFEIGEVALWVKPGPNFNREVTIVSPLVLAKNLYGTNTGDFRGEAWRYEIECVDFVKYYTTGGRLYANPAYLRKKHPPREDYQLISWNKCIWKPTSLPVT